MLLLAKSSPVHLLLLGLEVVYEHNDTPQTPQIRGALVLTWEDGIGTERRHGARTATVASGKIVSLS